MKNKNKFIKFFQKIKRARKRKKFWHSLFSFKMKKRKTKKKIKNNKFEGLFVLLIFILSVLFFVYQTFYLIKTSVEIEATKNFNEIQEEIKTLKSQIYEIEVDFNGYYLGDVGLSEKQKKIAEEVRHLNYLNAHLAKKIEQHNQDYSIQLFKRNLNELESLYRETVNIQLISSRIANKIDTLLLFEKINTNQMKLLEKDLDLFYEKSKLIFSN